MGGSGNLGTLLSKIRGKLVNFVRRVWARIVDVRGASMVEYALLIGLIALIVIAGAILLGDSLVADFSEFGSVVENAP